MTPARWRRLAGIFLVGLGFASQSSRAVGQAAGPIGTLGGYGGSVIGSYYTSRGGGYVPYGGMMGGYIPFSGSGLGTVPQPPRRIMETPVGGASIMMYGFRGTGMGRGEPRSFTPLGAPGGLGLRGGMRPMSGRRDMRTMPPGIGSPFREPPALTGPSAAMP
jgi:hypothetical protein